MADISMAEASDAPGEEPPPLDKKASTHPNIRILNQRREVAEEERKSRRTHASERRTDAQNDRERRTDAAGRETGEVDANKRALNVLAGIRQTRPTRDEANEEKQEPKKVLGTLTKRGARFPHKWQRRNFCFRPGICELRYFEGEELKGAMVLVGCEKTEAKQHGLYFESQAKMLLASADSESEQQRWISAVTTALRAREDAGDEDDD